MNILFNQPDGRGVRTKAQLKGLFSGEKEPPPGSSMIKRWARSISITLFQNQLLFLFKRGEEVSERRTRGGHLAFKGQGLQ